MRTLFVENVSPMSQDHALFHAGATRIATNRVADFLPSDPAQDFAEQEELFATLPQDRRMVKLQWVGVRSWGAVAGDDFLKPSLAGLVSQIESGSLDVTPDIQAYEPWTRMYRKSRYRASWVYGNDESGFAPWKGGNEVYNGKVDEITVRLLMSNRARSQLAKFGTACNSVPKNEIAIRKAFDFSDRAFFDKAQMELLRLWGQLRIKGLKDILTGIGLYPGTQVVQSFVGAFKNQRDENGNSIPNYSLYSSLASNWQLYSSGNRLSPRELTRHAFKFRDCPRWLPHWGGDDEPEDIADRLTFCSPNGAMLFVPKPDVAARLAPVVSDYCKGG